MSSRIVVTLAVLSALAYAAPHIWWMFGVSLGFPGDARDFDSAFDRTWFAIYNVVTTGLVLAGSCGVIAVEFRWVSGAWLRLLSSLVLIGAILLLVRGGLGLVTALPDLVELPFIRDGGSEPGPMLASLFWEAWFVLTGTLYGVVWLRRRVPVGG